MGNYASVDILLPVYNGNKYLSVQFDSLLNQSYKNIRIIVRDDQSTDNSKIIIQDYINKFPDKIFFIHSDVNLGSSLSFHELMKHATADYVMFCDQDDVWLPTKVEDSVAAITDDSFFSSNIRCVYTDLTIVDEELNEQHKSMRRALKLTVLPDNYIYRLCQSQVTGCTMILNRAAVDLLQNFPPPNRKIIHDHWYSIILSIFGNVKYLDKQTILYRQHSNNQVGVKSVTFGYFLRKMKALWKTFCYDMTLNNALPKEYRINTLHWLLKKVSLNIGRIK